MRQVKAPDSLRGLQEQFGRAMALPFDFADGRVRRRLRDYPPELVALMVPRQGLGGAQRLGVYNRQYWYRLFNVLQEDFPLLRALLTPWHFNRLASAYLTRHPSAYPSLNRLPEKLPAFLADGKEWDKPMLRQAAELDLIFHRAYLALEHRPLDVSGLEPGELEGLARKPLCFQAAFALFEEDWNLMQCRNSLGRHPKPEARVAPEPGRGHWAVYRTDTGVAHQRLSGTRFHLLKALLAGRTLEQALSGLMQTLPSEGIEELQAGIARWFAEWAAARWFAA